MARNYWLDYVEEMFGCVPDENGNMPCDNGYVCDRCDGVHEEDYDAWKANEIALESGKETPPFTDEVLEAIDICIHNMYNDYTDYLTLAYHIVEEGDYECGYPTKEAMKEFVNGLIDRMYDDSVFQDVTDDRCAGCGGEDCCCCGIWLERQADYEYENGLR